MFYFEGEQGKIICSAYSGIPLVRYDLKDNGGVCRLSGMKNKFAEFGLDLAEEAKKAKIDRTVMNLPFVYVYERADLSTTLYGLNIYPEHIKEVLVSNELVKNLVTGKFTMITKNDYQQNQFLELNIELKDEVKEDNILRKELLKVIVDNMKSKNSEYRELHQRIGKKAFPKIVLWPHGHDKYFCLRGKQKWVLKSS